MTVIIVPVEFNERPSRQAGLAVGSGKRNGSKFPLCLDTVTLDFVVAGGPCVGKDSHPEGSGF